MITLEQAIELAKNAHKNQWRVSRNMTNEEYSKYSDEIKHLNRYDQHLLSDGSKISFNGINFGWTIYDPYITHPLAVMNMMITDEEKIIAVLHDVFEQCSGYSIGRVIDNSRFYIKIRETLEEFDITYNIYCALLLLSKEKDIHYNRYINDIVSKQFIPRLADTRQNKLAIKIKIADMMHNMSETNNPKQKEKYLNALPILLKAL